MAKTNEKIAKEKDGTEHPYSYKEPETVSEALEMFGEETTLKLISVGLADAERKKATQSNKRDIMSLIENDPELKALYQQKLAEKKSAMR